MIFAFWSCDTGSQLRLVIWTSEDSPPFSFCLYSCTKLYCCNRGTNTSTSFGRSLRNCVRQGIESPSLDCEHGVVFSYHTTPHIHCPEKTEGCKISFSSVGRGASCRQSLGPIVLFVCWFVCFNTVACRQVVLFRYQVKTP